MKKFTFAVICLVVSLYTTIMPGKAQSATRTIAILPFVTNGIDSITAQTAGALLRLELDKLTNLEILSDNQTRELSGDNVCFDLACALEFAAHIPVDLVVMTRLDALGEKVIVTYQLVDINAQKSIVTDKTTSASIEDLETVMQRVATSLVKQEPIDKGAKVGVVMQSESQDSYRRGSNKFGGFAFGYLYPQNGYDNADRSFTMEFRTGSEMPDYNIGMMLAARKGFAMNIFSNWLFSRKDFCPYLGGAVGFHWINHNDYENYNYDSYNNSSREKKKGDGFEVSVNAGIIILRTYDVKVTMNLAFINTLNDYNDQAMVFTLGLLK